MRLKSQYTTGHATLLRLAFEQGQHGLVATVYAIKVTDRQRAGSCHLWVFETSKNLHSTL
jgi:hypothetical protein